MKRIFETILISVLAFSLLSCNGSSEEGRHEESNPNATPSVEKANPGGEMKDTTNNATKTDHQDPSTQTDHDNH